MNFKQNSIKRDIKKKSDITIVKKVSILAVHMLKKIKSKLMFIPHIKINHGYWGGWLSCLHVRLVVSSLRAVV